MNLNEAQQQQVRTWIQEGLQPAEIQRRLADQFGVHVTYMDVRFLLADLDLKPKDKEPAAAASEAATPKAPTAGSQAASAKRAESAKEDLSDFKESADDEGWGGGVSVTVDQVTRAGAVVSGKVTFSDGKSAQWYLDQMGRLGLMPKEKGYRPPQEDLMEFQTALQSELAKLGF